MHHHHDFVEHLRFHLIEHELCTIAILGEALRELILDKINNTSQFSFFKVPQLLIKFLFIMICRSLVFILLEQVGMWWFFLLWPLGLCRSSMIITLIYFPGWWWGCSADSSLPSSWMLFINSMLHCKSTIKMSIKWYCSWRVIGFAIVPH